MYGLEQLPLDMRANFELPVWPYSEDPEDIEMFQQYMRDLSVFYYIDSDTKVDNRDVSYPLSIKLWDKPLEAPFPAYMSSVYVDDNFMPIKWPGGQSESESRLQKLREHPIASDMFAWSNWNVKVEVLTLTTSVIRREILEEYLDKSLCHQGKCWKPQPIKGK